jgi:hypothetical protein
MSDPKIKSGFDPSNLGNFGANKLDEPVQTKNLTGDTLTDAQNFNPLTSAVEKKGYDNSASLKLKLPNNRQPVITDETVKTPAPTDDSRVFKTAGGTWRLKNGEAAGNPEFYRDGADTAGTTLFDKRFYQHEGKWIELSARGRLSDVPENKGKPRPDDVSEFDWQGWREVPAAEIPADYSAEGRTVAFADTQYAENQKLLFKRYIIDQNLVGDWDEVLGERLIDGAIQKGAKIEAVPTGEAGGNGKTIFKVKMSDESLAILRGELKDYQAGLEKGAQAQEKGRAEVINLATDIGGLFYETGRKAVDLTVNVVPDAFNSVLFPNFSRRTGSEPNFGRAKVGEMYDELSAQTDPNYKGNPIPRIETSAIKYDFRSEMMRRDINGKLDGDGIKAGDAITMTASVIAPIVVGKVLILAESPQSLNLPRTTLGISRKIILDTKHVPKHLPNTPESLKLIKNEGAAHVFSDESTMQKVSQEIIKNGTPLGKVRGFERFGLKFSEPIGYRISKDGSQIPLYYGK